MRHFLYRCPVTGLTVQGTVMDHETPAVGGVYHSMRCLACGQTHFVNPATGKLMSEEMS